MTTRAFVPLDLIDEAWMEIEADSLESDHKAYTKLETVKTYFLNAWLENDSIYSERSGTISATTALEQPIIWDVGTVVSTSRLAEST